MIFLNLLTLSFTNIQLFWILKIPHVLSLLIYIKYKLWNSKIPSELFFIFIAYIFMTIASVINPSTEYFQDLVGISICIFIFITSYGLAKYIISIDLLLRYLFLTTLLTSVIALSFYFFEYLFSYDLRTILGLKRDITSEFFGIKRNYGLYTEPGGFGYFYIALSGFLFIYFKNNLTMRTYVSFFIILASFLLTYSAGSFGIIVIAYIAALVLVNKIAIHKFLIPAVFLGAILFSLYSYLPPDLVAPLFNKLTISENHASSSNRLTAWSFGLTWINLGSPFGNGGGFIGQYFDHSLFNWFLDLAVKYGYLTAASIIAFFISIFVKISKLRSSEKFFYYLSILSIFGILLIVGVYHTVVYWLSLGIISALSEEKNV